MQKIVECVPNFSEGKDIGIINEIYNAGRQVTGNRSQVKKFGLEYNASHNRMLFTIVGEPEDVLNSVFASIKKATELIDMNSHVGEHPRIGATDVVPFVPVSEITMEECVELSNKLAQKVANELKIPVFMYEASAKREEYRNLADVRIGEYEGIKKNMRTPDYGPDKPHPTAGAVVIGARKYLVAYNVNLDTKDVEIAKAIAKKIREKDGGLPKVKALGFMIDPPDGETGGYAQVSMNLVDYEVTNFDEVYREIEKEAKILGIGIKNSEIYGMIPLEAIVKAIKTTFKGSTFKGDQILEKKLWE